MKSSWQTFSAVPSCRVLVIWMKWRMQYLCPELICCVECWNVIFSVFSRAGFNQSSLWSNKMNRITSCPTITILEDGNCLFRSNNVYHPVSLCTPWNFKNLTLKGLWKKALQYFWTMLKGSLESDNLIKSFPLCSFKQAHISFGKWKSL